jgi:hypothetical protein
MILKEGKLEGGRRGNCRFENSSETSGRWHLEERRAEKFRSVEDGKLRGTECMKCSRNFQKESSSTEIERLQRT